MPRIYDYERYIGSDKERQQLEADVQAGKVSLSVGATFMVTDGNGKIIDLTQQQVVQLYENRLLADTEPKVVTTLV